MSEWIEPKQDDVTYDKESDEIHVYLESNDFGARYVSIPWRMIKQACKKKYNEGAK